jgi:transketolase
VPVVYEKSCDFTIGKAITVRDGKDVTIIANGLMLSRALEAAAVLGQDAISTRVLDMHTVKPMDEVAVEKAARETGAIVTVEEHLLHGGMGSIVGRAVLEKAPVPMRFIGIRDRYTRSGKPDQLLERHGLTAPSIAHTVREFLAQG